MSEIDGAFILRQHHEETEGRVDNKVALLMSPRELMRTMWPLSRQRLDVAC